MEKSEAKQIAKLQDQVLKIAARGPRPISAATQAAFRAVPRHAFVKQIGWGDKWINVTPENRSPHLRAIYHNDVLPLWQDEEKGIYSTLSQPTLVLAMLDELKLTGGQKVFELGAGSGWSAALIGKLVEPGGHVYSLEIIPELAQRAKETIAELGIQNVDIIEGDAGDGYAPAAPYDRAVFTAGAYDLPSAFHEQVKTSGRLILVLKIEGGGDQLLVLEKKVGYFELEGGALCAFVPMTGKYSAQDFGPRPIEEIPEWPFLQAQKIESRKFWWGGGAEAAAWRSVGVRSFLTIVEPLFRVFSDPAAETDFEGKHYFFGTL